MDYAVVNLFQPSDNLPALISSRASLFKFYTSAMLINNPIKKINNSHIISLLSYYFIIILGAHRM